MIHIFFSASLTRRAVALAFIISIGAIGGLIGGQLYNESQKPQYRIGHTIALICTIAQAIIVIILRLLFKSINFRRSQMNEKEIQTEIDKYGGNQLASDRHPEFRYTL